MHQNLHPTHWLTAGPFHNCLQFDEEAVKEGALLFSTHTSSCTDSPVAVMLRLFANRSLARRRSRRAWAAAAAAPQTSLTCSAWAAGGAGRRASAAPRTWCTSERSIGFGACWARRSAHFGSCSSVLNSQSGCALSTPPVCPPCRRMKVSLEEMYKGSVRKLQMTRRWVGAHQAALQGSMLHCLRRRISCFDALA